MFCPKCGSEADEAASFCGKCGASFQEGDDGAHLVGVAASAPAFPRKRRRWPLVLVMAVMALLAIGVFAWCQQPGSIEMPTHIENYDSKGQLSSRFDYEYGSDGLITAYASESAPELITSNGGYELELRFLDGSSSTRYVLGSGGRLEQQCISRQIVDDVSDYSDYRYDDAELIVEEYWKHDSSRNDDYDIENFYRYQYQMDGDGVVTQGSSSDGKYIASYSYDDQGRLVEVRYGDGSRRVITGYVRIDRPNSLARVEHAARMAFYMKPTNIY